MKSIALLIDADNSSSKFIQKILSELASYGKVNIRRAYGNWTSTNLNGWQAIIQDHAIQPIQQYDLTKGKNATCVGYITEEHPHKVVMQSSIGGTRMVSPLIGEQLPRIC